MLPELRGCDVTDLGCGFGDFARYARERGAASVLGVDVSRRMLDEAQRLTDDPMVTYLRCSIEAFGPAARSTDLVVSSLALHYVADLPAVVRRVFDAVRPGGHFVVSVEHPMVTAHPADWLRDEAGVERWPVDDYLDEGPRRTRWFVDDVVKHHRTISAYVNALTTAGFRLLRLDEPGPSTEAVAARPELDLQRRRPPFLLMSAVRT
jgi:trans-aconitate methyltransferase